MKTIIELQKEREKLNEEREQAIEWNQRNISDRMIEAEKNLDYMINKIDSEIGMANEILWIIEERIEYNLSIQGDKFNKDALTEAFGKQWELKEIYNRIKGSPYKKKENKK